MKPFDFGIIIKELREAKGFSQTDLANKVGVEKSTISSYERNIATPSFDILKKLAIILNATGDYLLGLTDIRSIGLDNLTDEQSLFVLNHIENFKKELIEYEEKLIEQNKD